MARTARWTDLPEADAASIQASFDFLPEEMRARHRFGGDDHAAWAQRRAQLKLVDRQVITTGSRLAAARLREILRPAGPTLAETPSAPTESDRLMQQRAELRALGAALFYFRDEPPAMTSDAGDACQQRLHPRPLPARYFA